MNLELGGGKNPVDESDINVDIRDFQKVDLIHDLERGLPFRNNTYDRVYAYHVLEHISNITRLINEIHRVLKIGGKLVGEVPYYRDEDAFTDLTHKNYFTLHSFDYWDPSKKLSKLGYFDRFFEIKYIGLKRRHKYRFWKGLGPIQFELEVINYV